MEEKPSPELQRILTQDEKALIQAGKDARKLAEQTGTPLVIRSPGGRPETIPEEPTGVQ